MRTSRNPDPLFNADSRSNDRRHGRIRCDYLHCRHGTRHFGQVIDLSRSGMRLVHKGLTRIPKGAATQLILCWNQTQVTVTCRVAWERKIGLFTYLLGLEFEGVASDTAAVIHSLACKAKSSLLIASVQHDFKTTT